MEFKAIQATYLSLSYILAIDALRKSEAQLKVEGGAS